MKKFLLPSEHPYNHIVTCNDILKYLDKYYPPEESYLEISGGEPSQCDFIEEFVYEITLRGYHGLIKTNGISFLPSSPTVKRVAAWHEKCGLSQPPNFYDIILIIKNPDDCWQEKEQYCIKNNIPYLIFPFQYFLRPKYMQQALTDIQNTNLLVKYWTVMYSGGQLAKCYYDGNDQQLNILNMSPPPKRNIWTECPKCGNVRGFECFYTDILNNEEKSL